MNHAGIESGVGFQERADRLRRYIAAASEGDVRMERAQVRLEAGGEDGFLDAFVQLKQMRMAGAHSEPDNFWPAFAWKSSQTNKWQEERFPRDRLQLFHEGRLSFARHVAEEAQRQMHLPRIQPAHAAQVWIHFGEMLPDGFRKLDTDEEPFRSSNLNRNGILM